MLWSGERFNPRPAAGSGQSPVRRTVFPAFTVREMIFLDTLVVLRFRI